MNDRRQTRRRPVDRKARPRCLGPRAHLSAAIASVMALAAASADADDLGEALVSGTFNLDVRYRYEFVDQVGIARDANAHTLRTRFGYETGAIYDFRALIEAENVTGIGAEKYNDTINGKTSYPVVADPDNTEFNRYWLQYEGVPETKVKVGRQLIFYDNHRFVSNAGFRQNDQTFDAASLTTGIVPDVTASYAYVWLVNRIFGEDSPVGDFNTSSHLINLSYTGLDFGKLTGYAYLLDFDEAATLSSKTFGARFVGKRALGEDVSALYALEAAWQGDHANNPADSSFAYYLIEPGVAWRTVSARLGYEVLTGNGARAFQTPLATAHAFQGWADKFATTPGGGIEDLYLRLDYAVAGLGLLDGVTLTGVYHRFDAEQGGAHYGDELDAEISYMFRDHYTLGAKYAHYVADEFATGTSKVWVTLQIQY